MKLQNVRRWLNRYSTVMTIVAIAMMLTALAIIFTTMKPAESPSDVPVYFYDLNTGKTFVARSDRVPPIEAPSDFEFGGDLSGVRAHVYSCGRCTDDSERFVGWLETYTLEAKFQIQSTRQRKESEEDEPPVVVAEDDYEMIEQGHLIRSVDSEEWVTIDSEEGIAVMEAVDERCGLQAMEMCYPDESELPATPLERPY